MALTRWGEFEFATDQSMTTITNITTSAFRAALVQLMGPVAADALANDPDVLAAAVALAQSDAGLVREDTESVDTQYARVAIDTSRWIAEPDAMDRNGQTSAWVLANWAKRQRKALDGLVTRGDSMWMDFDALGTSTTDIIRSLVPVPVTLRGVSGQSITEIGLRQGGVKVFVTVAGGQLPASGPVSVTVLPGGTWRTGSAWSFTGWLPTATGFEFGTLAKDAADAWTFTRTTAGAAVAVPAESLWMSSQATGPMVGQLLRGGRNSPDLDVCVRDMRAMVTKARSVGAPVLVLPIYNRSTEPAGTPEYDLIMAINDEYAAIAGSDWLDTRGWMIRRGLAEMGITPTAQDLTDISNDVIPASLRHDTTHLNVPGRTAEGRFVARVTIADGWF